MIRILNLHLTVRSRDKIRYSEEDLYTFIDTQRQSEKEIYIITFETRVNKMVL